MSLPNPKELVKLAHACRKAGIKSFKSGDFEFTLTDEAPVSNYKKKTSEVTGPAEYKLETEELPYESLLNWSVTDIAHENNKDEAS